ncbi:tRNA-U20a,U20b-dihydrouridine synthase [Pseudobutyrivibrio sp. JW11]|uniref:tRNA dihydrouridine synthase n=1 Tax=Pseudobutyrivibrio sp. JW11 TaxID=1855302 RepID=UPI0008DECC6B|nr:tRNA-dihydrouridine synthase family protein [Pseudobutyrivibrio sp. JW11]SFN97912.1 tRNA-U20a,U20b-dihydrouridine synthase [Pseudobutyrivibrio sp. JW11]
MKKLYLAPLEGVTDSIYRNTFCKYYGGVDKVYTPFISPNSTFKFTTREFKDIDPDKNDVNITVPQLLTNNEDHFLWAAAEIAALGFKEINFNLGCPSGTVVAKKKGSGLLYYPEELDMMLDSIFNRLETECAIKNAKVPNISIKTRLGKVEPEEFYEILGIYNKYPISELTIHPRIQSDYYREPIRMEFFDYAMASSKHPIVYNGDLTSVNDIKLIEEKYSNVNAIMLGRGLISNPELASNYNNQIDNQTIDLDTFKKFHNELLNQYVEILSGEKPVLHRMKEFWSFWQSNFNNCEKAIKKIRKANKIQEYKDYVALLLNNY